MTRLRSLLTAIGLNAVPAFGWFVADWSAGTILVLYWMEKLINTLFVAVRILIHRRIRPTKGHRDYQAPQTQASQNKGGRSTYLAAFLVPTLVFTVAHGISKFVSTGHRNQHARRVRYPEWKSTCCSENSRSFAGSF